MTDKTEKTTDYRKKFSDALKVCLAESGIATAANLHKEMDARGYPVMIVPYGVMFPGMCFHQRRHSA